MKSYLHYKNKIEGFSDVGETVKTAEKIAASSIHFLKEKVLDLNIYAENIQNVLHRLSQFYTDNEHDFLKQRKNKKKMLVLVTGNKGLVSGLWHNIINLFLEKKEEYSKVVVVGEKGLHYLAEEKQEIYKEFLDFSEMPKVEEIQNLREFLFHEFSQNNFSNIDIIYPKFWSLAEQEAKLTNFLPFTFELKKNILETKEETLGLPIFRPNKKEIFAGLLEKYISMSLERIILESKLSELSARTVSMEHATAKTNEILKNLKLDFKKDRRRTVTIRQLESFSAHKTKKL